MKKTILLLSAVIWSCTMAFAQTAHPTKCGMQKKHAAMIAKHPEYAQFLKDQKASLQPAADFYKQYKMQGSEERTTAISAVPIIFHIVVDSAQFNDMGGTAGIIKRCDSQIAVLNHDYNQENSDSVLIPSGWKTLYSNVGIHFGLARVDPSGNCSPGYEVKIIAGTTTADAGFDVENETSPLEKTAGTGLAAWDNTKYYNVWCVNYTGGSTDLLGITTAKSDVTGGWAASGEMGVDILYNTLGSTGPTGSDPGTGSWFTPYNLGRTLTHETGHFFEIWHPWGDDGPYGGAPYYPGDGYCPWSGVTACSAADTVIGADDGLDDTPPESQAVYGSPTYTIAGGTYNDCCNMHGSVNTQPIGIACLSYMDYTDDGAMHMFTTDQANAMASMVLVPAGSATGATGYGTIGENYNLTQNPSLLIACTSTGVAPSPTELKSSLSVYPNPTSGEINISVNSQAETLNNIVVVNLLGQQVAVINGQNKDYYSIDLSGLSKGIYFVKCNFASGSVTRKILLQ